MKTEIRGEHAIKHGVAFLSESAEHAVTKLVNPMMNRHGQHTQQDGSLPLSYFLF